MGQEGLMLMAYGLWLKVLEKKKRHGLDGSWRFDLKKTLVR
jgi:hypothetical protein